ncbi:MAG TPA: cytochrome c [Candidatus Binatia bacterium]
MKKHGFKIFLVSMLLSMDTAAAVFAQEKGTEKEKAPAGSAENGYKAYMTYMCYTCHGTVGHGADRGTGPKLAPNPLSFASFTVQVRTPRQDMPAYRKPFVSDQEVADIYAYLQSIKPSPAAKDLGLPNY